MPAPFEIALDAEGGGEMRYSCTQQPSKGAKTCRDDLWFDGTFGRYTSSDSRGHYSILHGGFDRMLDPDTLVGIGAQMDRFTHQGRVNDQGADIKGIGWMAGPYVMARLEDNLYFDGGIRAGVSENRITMQNTGLTDTFSSQRWGAYGTLFGDMNIGRLNFRPSMSVVVFEDSAEEWTTGGGLNIPDVHTRKSDFEGGLRITHTMPNSGSSQYVELEGAFAFGGESENREQRARFGLGGTVADLFGGTLDAGVSLDGLGGDDWQAYDVKLGYSVSPDRMLGTVNAGLSFDGYGMEEIGAPALTLGFRSVPDLMGGVFSSDLSFGGGDIDGDNAPLSGKIGYQMRF